MAQLWGGRFSQNADKTNAQLAKLNCSLPIDRRLFSDDIDASKAYAQALHRANYLTADECRRIVTGFELVRYKWIEKLINFLPSDEDVHTVNERLLAEEIGEVGYRLHTGRSRNDQIVTDMKLWMRKAVRSIGGATCNVIAEAIKLAEDNLGVLMPGYTHLQRAQPVQFSHWMLSHMFALQEDLIRLSECLKRSNVLPLGCGALAGNPLGIDRLWLAKLLQFDGVTHNSMHTVGDRDFLIDFVYCCSMISLHLSRLAEDLILYASKEFDFVEVADAFSTGSSLMPQKRNPDSLELVRGMSGYIFSALTGIMVTIKGTPSTYNKDLQFDKKYVFEASDNIQDALNVTAGVLSSLKIKRHQMESALSPDMLATDWAYYLVRKGIPFRKAHHYIGAVVAHAEKSGVNITDITLGELQSICPHFEADILKFGDYDDNVEKYNVIGGTATKSIKDQIVVLKEFLQKMETTMK